MNGSRAWIVIAAGVMAIALARPPAAFADAAGGDSTVVQPPAQAPASDAERARIKATLELMGTRDIGAGRAWERRKNPRLAMVCSAVLPGLGQVYNGRRLKAGVMVGFASFYMGNTILNWNRYREQRSLRDLSVLGSAEWRRHDNLAVFHRESARDFLWWSGAVWLLGIIDSWIDAHLYDVREWTPSMPGEAQKGTSSVGFVGDDAGGRYLTFNVDF